MEERQKKLNKLIFVEGLTGSGKSIMAQFVSRQLLLSAYPSEWFHEAAFEHPLSVDDVEDMGIYKSAVFNIWHEFVKRSLNTEKTHVFDACYFNNCLETLFIHNESVQKIKEFAQNLQEIIKPLNPCLIYLFQPDTRKALEVNFSNRGESFKNFVIDFSEKTPVSQKNNWLGEEGMFTFWEQFVGMTHQVFEILSIKKLRIDNSLKCYSDYEKQVLDFLGLIYQTGPQPDESLLTEICGEYLPVSGHKREVRFKIYRENQNLIAGFLNYKCKLIHLGGKSFEAAGWYFVFDFERSKEEEIYILNIRGNDVDYLVLSGIKAKKIA